MGRGRKYDANKPQWSLLPMEGVREIINVMGFGAKKYSPDNWKKVANPRERYYNAAMKHLTAWFMGEKNDVESGYNHLAHAGCCILFLLYFDLCGEEKTEDITTPDQAETTSGIVDAKHE